MIEHHSAPPPGHPRRQRVLNESWPLVDQQGRRHAEGIKDRDPIPVTARVIFERDGEVWLDGNATRWHGRSVCIYVHDDRLQVPYVWLEAADVRRRDG